MTDIANKKITLKDIAKANGTNIHSVHCAIYGKPGVNPELREKILNYAKKHHYKANFVASSLSSKTIRIFSILPGLNGVDNYFYPFIWKGQRDYWQTVKEFNIEVEELFYKINEPETLASILENLWIERRDDINALFLVGTDNERIIYFLNLFRKHGIAIFEVANCARGDLYEYYIHADGIMAGKISADLIGLSVPNNKTIFIAAGSTNFTDQNINVSSFVNSLTEKGYQYSLSHSFSHPDKLYNDLKYMLEHVGNIGGMYSVTARDTVYLCKAAKELGLANKSIIIGSDLFEESRKYLQDGTLTAIVHKNPYMQGYNAAHMIFNYFIKRIKPASKELLVRPVILLKSNIDGMGDKERPYGILYKY